MGTTIGDILAMSPSGREAFWVSLGGKGDLNDIHADDEAARGVEKFIQIGGAYIDQGMPMTGCLCLQTGTSLVRIIGEAGQKRT